jgi:hypothetical protein
MDIFSMDFVEGLPTSGSANAILVVIDKFTKFGHFLPLHHPFNAQSVARLFMDQIYQLHGLPLVISLTEITSSLVLCGNSCSRLLVLTYDLVLLTTHKLMGKLSD